MINVEEVVNDPDVSESFTILRSTGSWLNGVWQPNNTQQIAGYGPVQPLSAKELEMIPEGDRATEHRAFWSAEIIYTTRATDGQGRSSDILLWNGLQYRVLSVMQQQDFGYYRAIAVRMKPD